jgi:hypothetical protein
MHGKVLAERGTHLDDLMRITDESPGEHPAHFGYVCSPHEEALLKQSPNQYLIIYLT